VTDFDRQVRSRTHVTHATICLAAGKRFSKYLRICVGPWVTSLNDSDRQVSKAADESFQKVFDTEKKREILWENYSVDVFKYISDVLTNETAKTIS
jgi:E3 ubiquitin-protein ligase listerin